MLSVAIVLNKFSKIIFLLTFTALFSPSFALACSTGESKADCNAGESCKQTMDCSGSLNCDQGSKTCVDKGSTVSSDAYGIEKAAGTANLPKRIGGQNSITTIAGAVVKSVLGLLGFVFFGLIFYAGFIWMTAWGKEERVTKAKDVLEAAIIGLALVLGAYAIANFIFSQLK